MKCDGVCELQVMSDECVMSFSWQEHKHIFARVLSDHCRDSSCLLAADFQLPTHSV
jgi:hypothetical protein